MAISLKSLIRSTAAMPPRILVYGTHGVGKTTLAAQAPNPVFIRTEDGMGALDVPAFPLAKSLDEVMEAFNALYTEDHGFQTLVLDSVDWLEPLVWQATAKKNNWADIETPGYGRGYVAASDTWRTIIDGINALRDERGMAVILIGHCDIKRFDSPETEPYDRYQPKLHARASALMQEHVDCVFFANYRVSTVKADVGFNKKVTRAVGGGDRLLYTQERPAFLAKNRYSMPDVLPMDFAAVAEHIPFFAKA